MNKILVLITTVQGIEVAEKIENIILQKRIAACVSFKKIYSSYIWNNEIEKNEEIEIVIKSLPEKLDCLIELLKKESSYEVSQIIYKLFSAEDNYFNWLKSNIN